MINILILGAAGFIGTNLTLKLAGDKNNKITLFDRDRIDFSHMIEKMFSNVAVIRGNFDLNTDFDVITKNQDVVFHLISTTIPSNSNKHIAEELTANIIVTVNLLEACVRNEVNKVVFLSSGGTVYGKEIVIPIKEEMPTHPISAYGLQKITIEKVLYLYQYLYGLDYRVIRLANPYGPYQRPNGVLGAVTAFTYKALRGEFIQVYGDGRVIRDFIYIDDAIRGIENIVFGENSNRTFNLGSGKGYSIKQVIETIQTTLGIEIDTKYINGRKADVPVNVLDISRYEEAYGKLEPIGLSEGIRRTAEFLKGAYEIEVPKHIRLLGK
ncbi:MAG: UDP-glucose 4-epimerase [Candidatus Dichloromethanomonas elyunquensis]|nr:MAG: UDP-glucose 4-epimerase [Candidatus Dichloromethanomonas elyunquensis]